MIISGPGRRFRGGATSGESSAAVKFRIEVAWGVARLSTNHARSRRNHGPSADFPGDPFPGDNLGWASAKFRPTGDGAKWCDRWGILGRDYGSNWGRREVGRLSIISARNHGQPIDFKGGPIRALIAARNRPTVG